MAMKLDMDTSIKYLGYGAGGVALPAFLMSTGFAATLAKIPGWSFALGMDSITVGGIVLASVGIGLVDMLFFSK